MKFKVTEIENINEKMVAAKVDEGLELHHVGGVSIGEMNGEIVISTLEHNHQSCRKLRQRSCNIIQSSKTNKERKLR